MSSVFDNLTERATGMVGRDDFGRPPLSCVLKDDPTGQIRDYTTDRNEQFALTALLTVTYWANRAQRREARKVAEKTLASLLYSDALRALAGIRQAVSDGDRSLAMTRIADLEHTFVHGSPL